MCSFIKLFIMNKMKNEVNVLQLYPLFINNILSFYINQFNTFHFHLVILRNWLNGLIYKDTSHTHTHILY